jgi:hypothetical protein
MRPAALSLAVLLGIATLGAADARATPALSATIVIDSERTVHVGGKPQHHFRHGPTAHWHKGLAGHHKRWQAGPSWHRHKALARHHSRWHDGRHHRPVWTNRFHQAPVVIVKPARGHWFGHRYLPPRPLIRHGSFARGPYYW